MLGTLVVAGVSGYLGHRQQEQAADAREDMVEAMKEQTQLGQDQLDFARERWRDYEQTYGGLRDQMVSQAEQGIDPRAEGHLARADTDVALAAGRERDQHRREMERRGVDPTSGQFQGQDRMAGLQEATARTQARGEARRSAAERTDALRGSVFQVGQQERQAAEGLRSQAHQNLSNMRGQQAQVHGGLAAQHSQGAGQMYGMAVDHFSSALDDDDGLPSWNLFTGQDDASGQSQGAQPGWGLHSPSSRSDTRFGFGQMPQSNVG
ncbi:hypothetical protein [Halorhodospira halophila]|uniref:hypothetical protein n=1 Tax=Halorhodospira halophila TaxID=1053 RepID=UPI001914CA69|nr:hypothetical protein [Halorhodospira halophila]MBK5942698.1 hypothetical protein [Halorhodospira halophila]